MNKEFLRKLFLSHQECTLCPSPAEVSEFYVQLLSSLFADFRQLSNLSEEQFIQLMHDLKSKLERLIRYDQGSGDPVKTADKFFDALPVLVDKLHQDVTAMFEGDPAA